MTQGNILIIDDDEVDRKATQRALIQAGWEGGIVHAVNAAEALEHLANERFDCLLLDYQLPGQDGLDLLNQLHARSSKVPPIVMLTGEGNEMVAVEAMKRGAFDYLPKSQLAPNILYRIIVQAVEKARLQEALANAQAQLKRQALYDTLTGLGNRNLFMRDLHKRISSAQRSGNSFCLLLMDLDQFKVANDRFGHDAGDYILAEFGRRVLAIGRASDTFYRLGGDEFTALIQAGDIQSVLPIAERIQSSIASPFIYMGNVIDIYISIGIAIFPDDGTDLDTLLKTADSVMYRAKNAGGGIASSDGVASP